VALVQGPLFGAALPDGFRYARDFITPEEEALISDKIARIEFSTFEMRGVVARRRVAFFGHCLSLPLRQRIARWASLSTDAFAMSLINEYPPGAPIGWHRDAQQYGIVGGVSLLSPCRMRLRPYVRPGALTQAAGQRRAATHELLLEQRAAYLMTGESRMRSSTRYLR